MHTRRLALALESSEKLGRLREGDIVAEQIFVDENIGAFADGGGARLDPLESGRHDRQVPSPKRFRVAGAIAGRSDARGNIASGRECGRRKEYARCQNAMKSSPQSRPTAPGYESSL